MEPLRIGQDPPWVVAHRGASHNRPENTAAAFDQALAEGCDGFELDLQLSRDGVPVVYHDRTLEKIGAGRKRVSSLRWKDLQLLDAGSWFEPQFEGEALLSLEEVLEIYAPRTRLFLEIKAREDGERLARLARKTAVLAGAAPSGPGLYLLCFEPEALVAAAEEVPEMPRVLNMRAPSSSSGGLPKSWEGLAALSMDVRRITTGFVERAHSEGKPVLAFTCNREKEVERACKAGADAIFSDRPGWLASQLARGTRS